MARRLWQNWAKTLHCTCDVENPANVAELQEIVRRATDKGKRVRATGGGYSWSPLVPTDGVIVDMRRFQKIELLRESPGQSAAAGKTRIIEVGAGVTIGELDRFARAKSLTLVSPPLFLGPTVGGAVAVGCHGTGMTTGNFCDQLHEIRLVCADGRERTVGRGAREFPAAMVALGTLGIVTAVKLEVVPQFPVHVDKRYVPVHYVSEEFDDLVPSYEYPEMLWFPFSRKMWLYLMDRSKSPPDRRWGWTRLVDRFDRFMERWAGNHLLPWVARRVPRLTPFLLRAASALVHEASASVQLASDAFHFMKSYPKNLDLCYAVPVEYAKEAWHRVIVLLEEWTRAELYPVNLAVHCRFTGGSQAWLAPDYGRKTCYIEIATLRATPRRVRREFLRKLEERWADLPEARPHWGKHFERWQEVRRLYPKMDEFLRVREEWDPKRVFLNSFLERDVFQLKDPAPPERWTQISLPPRSAELPEYEQVAPLSVTHPGRR
jgi:FAD/FMN-containing dehydrogenase